MKVRELGQNPISQDKPAGDDAHYEPEFEELQQEIDKLSIATTSGGGTDWKRVTTLCVTILSEKSKDLLVAAYLVTGLTNTHGFEGFTVGTAFMADLVENFWDTLFPPKRRMRGRMNALSWWMERMEGFLKSLQEAEPLPQEQVDNANKNLNRLDESLSEKSDDAPSMRSLLDYLSLVPVQEPEPEPEPEPAAAAEPEQSQSEEDAQQPEQPQQQDARQQKAEAAPQSAESPKPAPKAAAAPPAAPHAAAISGSDKDVDAAFRSALNQLLGVADYHLKNSPASSLSYRLRRLATWLPITSAPPAQDGKTMLPPPEETVKPSLEQMSQAGNHEALLQASEERVTEYLYWLDLTRYTATALDNLGGAYKDAYDAICGETLLMIQRLQGIENLSFSDGTPFADQETRTWLKNLSLGSGGGAMAGGDESQQAVAAAFQEAHELLKGKKQVEAVDRLQQGLNAAGSGKQRLLWRLGLGRLLLMAGRAELADSMAQAALADVAAFRLEEWDPPLAVQTLQLAYDACDAMGGDEDAPRAKEMLLRLNRLDPSAALKISGAR